MIFILEVKISNLTLLEGDNSAIMRLPAEIFNTNFGKKILNGRMSYD